MTNFADNKIINKNIWPNVTFWNGSCSINYFQDAFYHFIYQEKASRPIAGMPGRHRIIFTQRSGFPAPFHAYFIHYQFRLLGLIIVMFNFHSKTRYGTQYLYLVQEFARWKYRVYCSATFFSGKYGLAKTKPLPRNWIVDECKFIQCFSHRLALIQRNIMHIFFCGVIYIRIVRRNSFQRFLDCL